MILTSKTGGRRPTEKNRGGRVESLRRFYHREPGHVVVPRGTLADNRLYAWMENISQGFFSFLTCHPGERKNEPLLVVQG